MLVYPAANRDPAVFSNPDAFDIGRGEAVKQGREHRAFGVGEHFCLGVRLARAEMQVMFEQIIPRLRNPRLAGPMSRIASAELTAAREMRIVFDPEPAGARATA